MNYLNAEHGPCTDFQLRAGSTGKNKSARRIKCRQGRVGNQSIATQHATTTSLPTCTADTCPFAFTVYHDTELDQWYFRQNSGKCWRHIGHPPVPREMQYDSIRYVPEDTLKTAQDLLMQLIPPSIVTRYIETASGKSLSDSSINHLRKLVLDKKHGVSQGSDETTAEKLLKILEETPGMSYITYTGK